MKFASIIVVVAFMAFAPQAADGDNGTEGTAWGRSTKNSRPTSERKRTNLRHGRDLGEEMSIPHVEEDTALDTTKLAPVEFSMPAHVEKDMSMPTLVEAEPIEFTPPSTTSAATETSYTKPAITTSAAAEQSYTKPTITAVKPSCDPFETCYEEGSTCARGTETCCGETHDSLRCSCGDSGNGRLQYMCFYTEACMVPSCCWPGPPADKPPPVDGTCNPGSLCDTGIDDDYCCYDMMGGRGSYCSKSGGSIIPAIEIPGKCEVGFNADPAKACGTGEFCELDTGACNSQSDIHSGLCAEIPDMCTEEWDPACGCDQKTYSNVCFAHAAGTSVSRIGECDSSRIVAIPGETTSTTLATAPIEQQEFSVPEPVASGKARKRKRKDNVKRLRLTVDMSMPALVEAELSMPIEQREFAMPSGRRVEEDTTFGRRVTEDLSMPIEQMTFSMPAAGRHLIEGMSMPTLVEAELSMPIAQFEFFKPSCDVHATCYEEGSTCARGTESCCGETHDSLRCTCEDSGNGRLQYQCFHTEACMIPSCCWPGPPADKPPPADGTCNPGSLCDTGIDDDYCCYDMMGGRGSYCSKSGGTTSATTMPIEQQDFVIPYDRKLLRKDNMKRRRLTEDMSMPALVEDIEQLEFSMPGGRRVEEDTTFGRRVTEDLSMPTEQLEFSMPVRHLMSMPTLVEAELSMPIEQLEFPMPEPVVSGKARKLERKGNMKRHRLTEDMSMPALVEDIEQLEFSMPTETTTSTTTSCLPEGSGSCHLRHIGMDNKCHNAAALVCGEECGGYEACCPDGFGGYVAPSYCYVGRASCPCSEEV